MVNVTNVSDLGKERLVPEAFEHYTKHYSHDNIHDFKNAGSFRTPSGTFDPVEYRICEASDKNTNLHWMIIDDPFGHYWCMSWEENDYGYYHHKVFEVISRYQGGIFTWHDKYTKNQIIFGEKSSTPLKEEYGCTCVVCKQHNEYAIKRNNHTCNSCKSYQIMYSGTL